MDIDDGHFRKINLILTLIKNTSASQEFETFSKYATANIFFKRDILRLKLELLWHMKKEVVRITIY